MVGSGKGSFGFNKNIIFLHELQLISNDLAVRLKNCNFLGEILNYFKMVIIVEQGDITQISVDAIVNAANSSLLGGGGVDGAIHRAGGAEILADCLKIRARQGGCAIGAAVITTAGNLPAKKVIHTVGPVWLSENSHNLDKLLADCYKNSLTLAQENNLKTITFPNISTGIYRYPKQRAASIAIRTVQDYLLEHPAAFEQIIFVCFDKENFELYQQNLREENL